MPWGQPRGEAARLRDHPEARSSPARAPVSHEGKEIQLPYQGPGSASAWASPSSRSCTSPQPAEAHGWAPARRRQRGAHGGDRGRLARLRHAPQQRRTPSRSGSRRASPAPGGGKGYDDFEIQGGVSVTITDDVKGPRCRSQQALRRPLRGRHGAPEDELPQQAHAPRRLGRGGGPHPRALPGGQAARRPSRRCRTTTSTRAVSSVRSSASGSAGASSGSACRIPASRFARSRMRPTI